MLRRCTSGLLAVVLFGALAGGVAFQRGGGESCPMRGMSCCKRARAKNRAPGLAAARLCCLTNYPQPAPTGTNFTFRASSDASTSPKPAAARQAQPLPARAPARDYSPPFQPSHSPPAYIQHAAFLI